MKEEPTISQFGDHGILIRYPKAIVKTINQSLTQHTHYLVDEYPNLIEGFTITYQESAIYLNPEVLVESAIRLFTQKLNKANLHVNLQDNSTVLHIPVCYEASFALDIEEIAEAKSLKVSEIIEFHTQRIYPVYFIGFSPGFPYLGGMNEKIAHPRKASPRTKVEAGSVGIAGSQTGVYPNESPGGWNIIGRSPLNFFNTHKERPSLLKAGDYIRFEEISLAEFERIQQHVKEGSYSIHKSRYND